MFSVIEPIPASPSSCGYCGPPGERSDANTNLHVACFNGLRLSCDVSPTSAAHLDGQLLISSREGIPEDDRPRMEAVGHLLLQA